MARASHVLFAILLVDIVHSLRQVRVGFPNEDSSNETYKLLFGTHHKTGSELTHRAAKCFVMAKQPALVNTHFWGNDEQAWRQQRVIHMVRNPYALLASEYLYHKDVGEAWSKKPGSAILVMDQHGKNKSDRVKHMKWLQAAPEKSESYTTFLRRTPMNIGMHAEMLRLQWQLNQMDIAHKMCVQHKGQCLELCLEDFTVSSKGYDAAWKRVLRFTGLKATSRILRCLQRFDLHRIKKKIEHVTAGTISEEAYLSMVVLGRSLDVRFFNGRLFKLAYGPEGPGPMHCHTGFGWQPLLNPPYPPHSPLPAKNSSGPEAKLTDSGVEHSGDGTDDIGDSEDFAPEEGNESSEPAAEDYEDVTAAGDYGAWGLVANSTEGSNASGSDGSDGGSNGSLAYQQFVFAEELA